MSRAATSLSSADRLAFSAAFDLLDAENQADAYRSDGPLWVHDRLDEFLWSTQREIMASVRDNRYTAVKACHGPGKSRVASRIAAWWMNVHPPGTAKVVSTAPTFQQVEAILWSEINDA